MRKLSIWLVGAAVAGMAAPPAHPQAGGGLYEPFSEPASAEQVRDFIRGLNGGREFEPLLSDRLLENGTTLPGRGFRGPHGRLASARAGTETDAGFLDGWPLATVVLALSAGGTAAAARFRR